MVRVFDSFDRGSFTVLFRLLIATDQHQTDVFVKFRHLTHERSHSSRKQVCKFMFGEAAVDQNVGWKLGRCHWMAREGVSSSRSMCRKLRGMGQQKSKQKKEQKIIAYLEVPKIMEVVQWLGNQPQKPKSSPWDHLNSKAEWECPQRWQRWCLRNRNHSLSFLQRRNGRSARRGSGIAFFTVPGAILK